MNRSYVAVVIALTIAFTVVSCKQAVEKRSATVGPPPASQSAKVERLGRNVPAESVWPPPTDAIRTSEKVISKTVVPGTGKQAPALNQQHVLAIGYVAYDKAGRVTQHVPLMVQAIDLAPTTWRDVLVQMRRGEVRRAWITMPDGTTTIMDFEVRSISRIAPDGTAANID